MGIPCVSNRKAMDGGAKKSFPFSPVYPPSSLAKGDTLANFLGIEKAGDFFIFRLFRLFPLGNKRLHLVMGFSPTSKRGLTIPA